MALPFSCGTRDRGELFFLCLFIALSYHSPWLVCYVPSLPFPLLHHFFAPFKIHASHDIVQAKSLENFHRRRRTLGLFHRDTTLLDWRTIFRNMIRESWREKKKNFATSMGAEIVKFLFYSISRSWAGKKFEENLE